MKPHKKWLRCSECGALDISTKAGHVGTFASMRCPDCSDSPDVRAAATKCRNCCPTGHGTRWNEPERALANKGRDE